MADELVSIVVPAHNAAADLRRSLLSILAQTYPAIEVIAVNDGSTDDTARVLDELALTDPRLKVIHLAANVGIQAARAAGVSQAVGHYIGFVDADDWVAPEMYATLVQRARATAADIVLCGALTAHDERRLGPPKVRFRRSRVIEDRLLERFCRFEFGTGVLWNKLYRAPLLRPHAAIVLGRDVRSGEDYIVNVGCFADATRVATVAETLYYYHARPGSVSRAAVNATRFTRLLIAYVACLEIHAPSRPQHVAAIDGLYARQLRLGAYTVPSPALLGSCEPEIRDVLLRLAAIHPAGIYALIHAYDLAAEPRPRGLLAAAREVSAGTRALLRAFQCVS